MRRQWSELLCGCAWCLAVPHPSTHRKWCGQIGENESLRARALGDLDRRLRHQRGGSFSKSHARECPRSPAETCEFPGKLPLFLVSEASTVSPTLRLPKIPFENVDFDFGASFLCWMLKLTRKDGSRQKRSSTAKPCLSFLKLHVFRLSLSFPNLPSPTVVGSRNTRWRLDQTNRYC